MNKSDSISKLMPALLKAQAAMGGAKKGSTNPYFKSRYADLGAVLEACKELLNDNGITILQPHVVGPTGAAYVETLLIHESGEWLSSVTPIEVAKERDPQALGSAITYARRYGLQSFLSMPAEDDDGESAMQRKPNPTKGASNGKAEPAKTTANNEGAGKDISRGAQDAPVSAARPTKEAPMAAKSGTSVPEEAPEDREILNKYISEMSGVLIAKRKATAPELRSQMKTKYGVDDKVKLTDVQAREFYGELRASL